MAMLAFMVKMNKVEKVQTRRWGEGLGFLDIKCTPERAAMRGAWEKGAPACSDR